ncbi:UPF0182 family protein [Janibacter melonis]|uniref:UPF0182 family membrane protein n=1 Tax=Janibacter melonis TaxID=262209 RepID=UPI001F3DCF50|nr:UPF0182 family protein [Janibacter melonis]
MSTQQPPEDGDAPTGREGGAAAAPSSMRTRGLRVLAVLAALVVAVLVITSIWTEALWFDALGYSGEWWSRIRTQTLLFVLGGLLIALPLAASLVIPFRSRPMSWPTSPGEQALSQYRQVIAPLRRHIAIGVPLLFGLMGGLTAAGQWQQWLLWRNGAATGVTDPQFGRDLAYYLFGLPFYSFVVGYLTVVAICCLVAAAFAHYIYGGLQPPGRGRSTRAAFLHLAVVGAVLALLRGVSYVLDAHSLTTHETSVLTGVGYTDANAVIPAKYILAVAAVICAGLFFAAVRSRSWRLPVIGVATLVGLSIIVGNIYPALVETYRVTPSRSSLEQPYLQHNIDSTRAAYDVAGVETEEYDAVSEISAGQLRQDAATIPGIRLLDPNVAAPTFQQLQAQQPYYSFPEDLDVDRYDIDGESTDTVVGARELDLSKLPADRRDWVNDHTVYTHGYGLVAAKGSEVSGSGTPAWFDLSEVEEYEPRIYFGERMTQFSIVGGDEGAPAREVDRPSGGEEGRYTYTGDGGVSIGSPLRQAAFAITHRDLKFVLSDAVGSQSRLLEHRTPKERVARVAPWLTLDNDPYPTVVDGRIQWVVDGYTTSRTYPYASRFSVSGVQEGTVSSVETQRAAAINADRINYMRNSVKATVDAYDGTVTLYRWDEQDPVASAWDKAFPGLMKPRSEISGDLMSHLRYPEDLFRMQRAVLAEYHVTSAGDFRAGQDRWRVPSDPTVLAEKKVAQPPYFLTMAMPSQQEASWSLTSTYIPNGDRDVMAGYLAVDSDAGDIAGKPASGYGQLRMLAVPRSTTVPGPGQVQNDIASSSVKGADTDQTLTDYLNNNNRGSSKVLLGNQMTLPVGEGFLHVEPVYLSGTNENSYPSMRVVIVSFGGRIAWARTLEGALDQLFEGDSGADAPSGGDDGGTQPPKGEQEPTGPLTSKERALRAAIEDMQGAYQRGQEALKKGDLEAYGKAQADLRKALTEAARNQPGGGSATLDESAAS